MDTDTDLSLLQFCRLSAVCTLPGVLFAMLIIVYALGFKWQICCGCQIEKYDIVMTA